MQIEIWRGMTVAQKFALIADLNESANLFVEAGIRARHPEAGPEDVRMRRFVLMHGEDVVERVWGWRAPERR